MAQSPDDREHLAALADDLLRQAAEIRRQWTELAHAVGIDPDGARPPGDRGGAGGERHDLEQMRLVALDMMLSGAEREQVAEHLRSAFARDDVDGIVDEVFEQYGA